MRQAWTAVLLVVAACGGEMRPSTSGGPGAGGAPGGGRASSGGTGAIPTPASGGALAVPAPAPRYTGEPGVEMLDGHTCAHDPLPPGLPILDSDCRSAADCRQEPNGRCVGKYTHECKSPSGGGWDPDRDRGLPCEPYVERMIAIQPGCWDGQCFQFLLGRCIYDACSSDSECEAGERCSCDPSGNRCVPSECYTDSDCPAGERCAAVPSICDPEIGAYACTTPDDDCEPGSSCSDTEYGGYCMPWSGGPWQCIDHTCGR